GASEYDREVLAKILSMLGRVEKVSGRLDEAIVHMKEAIEIFETLRRDHPSVLSFAHSTAFTYKELAQCAALAGRIEEKKNALSTAIGIWESLVVQAPGNGSWESNLADALDKLGTVAQQQGQS